MPIDKNGRLTRLLVNAFLKLKATFNILIRTLPEFDGTSRSGEGFILPYGITSKHVALYMRALGTIGDAKEMVRLMRWILEAWERNYGLDDARHPQEKAYDDIVRTIAYFCHVGKYLVEPAVMRDLQDQLEKLRWEKNCTWVWPMDESGAGDTEIELDVGAADRWSHVREMVYGDLGVDGGDTPSDGDSVQ
jgi:hypothetical protein